MAKDPAFLFYYSDFLVGTTFMTLEEKGAYITIICYLADKGKLTVGDITKIISDDIWVSIRNKFIIKGDVVSHKRLMEEDEKRKNYCESRRKNISSRYVGHTNLRMENENENINKDIIDNKRRFKKPTVAEVKEYCKERKNKIDAEAFVAFYESKGWKVGNQPMKSWKASIITWEKRDKKEPGSIKQPEYEHFKDNPEEQEKVGKLISKTVKDMR